MKMKMSLMGFVSVMALAACGGPGPEAGPVSADEPTTSRNSVCEGWDSGARRCSWKCISSASQWSSVGVGVVAYDQCQDFANTQCDRTAYATCWSR